MRRWSTYGCFLLLRCCCSGSRQHQRDIGLLFYSKAFWANVVQRVRWGQEQCILGCAQSVLSHHVWVNLGTTTRRRWWETGNTEATHLLPIATVFCHHFPQCLQHFDAQTLLILLQQLLRVFDQSGHWKRKKSEHIHMHWWKWQLYNHLTLQMNTPDVMVTW